MLVSLNIVNISVTIMQCCVTQSRHIISSPPFFCGGIHLSFFESGSEIWQILLVEVEITCLTPCLYFYTFEISSISPVDHTFCTGELLFSFCRDSNKSLLSTEPSVDIFNANTQKFHILTEETANIRPRSRL